MKSIPLFGAIYLLWGGSSLAAQTPMMADAGVVARAPSGIVVATHRVDQESLPGRVTVDLRDVTIEAALRNIAQQAGLKIAYANDVLPKRFVTVSVTDKSVDEVLAQVLRGTGLDARISVGNILRIVRHSHQEGLQGQGTITGRVLHAKTRQPIAGVKVTINGSNAEATTGADGMFRITAPAGAQVLSVRHIGFVRQSKDITVAEDQTVTVNVELNPSANVLGEVVVTGTIVATERRAIPNPITVITAEEIERRGIARVEQLLRGEVPGVIALNPGVEVYDVGSLGYNNEASMTIGNMVTSSVFSRGASNFRRGEGQAVEATAGLKTFVDGVELADPSFLGTIDPRSIERIEIITGPQAATVYGSGAMGGVMQIFTKKGRAGAGTNITVRAQYGVLQSSMSNGLTPSHNDGINITGGLSPTLSYAASGTYQYQGQWLAGLFRRSMQGSIGATHRSGPLTLNANLGMTLVRNGGMQGGNPIAWREKFVTGVWSVTNPAIWIDQRIATASSQNLSMNVDHTINEHVQHHLVFGRSQAHFKNTSQAKRFRDPTDTLYAKTSRQTNRNSFSYSMTAMNRMSIAQSTLTVGLNGTWADQADAGGCTATKDAVSYVSCGESTSSQDIAVRGRSETSRGGFASWRAGLWERLYLTLGIRAEQNHAYGRDHRIDWTPTNGLTYVMDWNDISIKFLGSYGKATRPPIPSQKDEIYSNLGTGYDISNYLRQRENLLLGPERSQGPQGGIEVYWGNRGSLTVNHYRQTVQDLIEGVIVDSIPYVYLATGDRYWLYTSQYQNVGSILQTGWETTGNLNIGILTLKGTYSWNDSRVKKSVSYGWNSGDSFRGIPTHTGYFEAHVAQGTTSLTFSTSYVGAFIKHYNSSTTQREVMASRLKMYMELAHPPNGYYSSPGYIKSDLAVSQRINSYVTAELNITNVGNRFRADVEDLSPSLGRQTLLGFSFRFPQR